MGSRRSHPLPRSQCSQWHCILCNPTMPNDDCHSIGLSLKNVHCFMCCDDCSKTLRDAPAGAPRIARCDIALAESQDWANVNVWVCVCVYVCLCMCICICVRTCSCMCMYVCVRMSLALGETTPRAMHAIMVILRIVCHVVVAMVWRAVW